VKGVGAWRVQVKIYPSRKKGERNGNWLQGKKIRKGERQRACILQKSPKVSRVVKVERSEKWGGKLFKERRALHGKGLFGFGKLGEWSHGPMCGNASKKSLAQWGRRKNRKEESFNKLVLERRLVLYVLGKDRDGGYCE